MKNLILGLLLSAFTLAHAQMAQFGVIGDAGVANTNTKMIRESMLRAGTKKTIMPGDNIYMGSYDSVWKVWTEAGFTYDVVAIGNHNNGYQREMDYFKMPSEYYSKTINGARFIVLNSDNDRTGPEQAKWLEGELQNAFEPLIFLVYHHPSYRVSSFHGWESRANFQRAIRPIIWRYRSKITALLVGHDHLASIIHFNDLPVILSGAVHENRNDKPVDYVDGNVRVRTSWLSDPAVYWAKLSFSPNTKSARVDFVRGLDDRNNCTITLMTGVPAHLHSNCFGNQARLNIYY